MTREAPKMISSDQDPDQPDRALDDRAEDLVKDRWISDFITRLHGAIADIGRKK